MTHESVAKPDPVVEAVQLLRILADPTRLRLLGLLQGGPLNVTTLCQKLDLAQPTVSHHLGLLRSLKLVTNRREGKQVFYALNAETVTNLDEQGGLTVAAGPVKVRFCNTTCEVTEPAVSPHAPASSM
jgi:DNA-binding transcriptional ArsR family regulator